MQQTLLLLHSDELRATGLHELLAQSGDDGFDVESIEGRAAAIARLNDATKAPVAAVLMDLRPGNGEALEGLDAIFDASPHIPILLVIDPQLEDVAKAAVQRGAQDYILDDRLDSHVLSKALHNMLERVVNAEALFVEKERAVVTLNSIGDAVISTDAAGRVSYLNRVAEDMTGWMSADAIGRSFEDVFKIIDSKNPHLTVNPMAVAMQENRVVALGASCILIRRDGAQFAIEDSAAPIHDRKGRLTGAVMVFHDVTQARAMSQRMSYLAHHDYLTELPNRLLLDDRLAQAMSSARRQQRKLAVLYLDVDRFKHINDTLGHAIGDGLLVSIAARLVASVRASDTVSRQGGDEFVVLLPTIGHAEDAALSATKLLAAIGMPHHFGGHDIQVTASIGIGIFPNDGTEAETLVRNADTAMLNAKDVGRNNYQFYSPDMNEHALERRSIEGGLRNALERQEFVLHYQPKMDLGTATITGAEALIRWRQAQGALVMPERFIPVAEECGHIVPIGRWVLREVCRQRRRWLDARLAPIPIAVNVSAVELRSKNFVEDVIAILDESGLDPSHLELELTETALMQESQSSLAAMRALNDLGIQLTLDDFGTGYSSLSYLKRFPIDALKIDKSFVRGLCTSEEDANIVSAVIHMGKSFRLGVIAEGVETRDQFLRLQALQCSEGQGHYFQEPIPGEEFAKLLTSDSTVTIVA